MRGTYIEGAEDVPSALAAAEFDAGNADAAKGDRDSPELRPSEEGET